MKIKIIIILALALMRNAAGMEMTIDELNKQLIHAAKVGDTDKVAHLLEKQQKEENEKKSSEITNLLRNGRNRALLVAADNDNEEVIQLFLSHDINVNVQNEFGQTPLHKAIWGGHIGIIKLLLTRADIDVNKKTDFGWTPLFFATRHNKREVIKLLLGHPHTDIHTPANDNETPLKVALAEENGEILTLLFNHTVPDTQKIELLKKLNHDPSTYFSLMPHDMVVGACGLYQRAYSITDEQARKIAQQVSSREVRTIIRNELRKRALAREAIKKSVTIKKRKTMEIE